MDENKEKKEEKQNLDKAPQKKPKANIKKSNIIIIGVGLVLILGFSLLRMGKRGEEEKTTVEEVKQEESIATNNDSFQAVDYTKAQEEEDKLNLSYNIPATEPSEEENIEILENSVKTNEALDNYYEKMLSEEMAAQTGVIEFGVNTSPQTSGHLPEVHFNEESSLDLSRFQTRENIVDDFNKQGEKRAFLSESAKKNYNSFLTESPLSKYELKAGGIIPGIMLTGINSDLPGTMIANVREDVYDTVTGKFLLIPKGTRVVGKYSSAISFGQSRVLVVWQRLIFPNGKSLNLDNFEGTDMSGYSGLVGKVDNHTLKLFQGVVLSSILGAAAGIIDNGGENNSWRNNAGKGAGEEIVSIGEAIASRLLAVQPTITIKPGARFNIMVNSDLILEPYHK
ncbi:bacterial conjugation TrbI-like protein [Fusobacterium gonidiaformans 3-1-5R]|uniref:Bacterial conjugation TrbI-like protein n=1 Tax=Fusobacterium gonidiaformans 3-1-5R TaxID=469605 RepID=E5BFJ1_9FUSO|nr:TrbI/VirB10 family protein [Fusobacterium gonidiaformans]EFS20872.1 bacterial conjugation TrbI-like protein [Fusobacterium gonidiaformans 3-1-5R]